MRIITGTAKGTKLKAPKGLDVRPTADRVKESVFNILSNLKMTDGHPILGAKVLDLFAGTGNLGLEALSRGADQVLFVDNSLTSLAAVKDNIASTKLSAHAELLKGDSVKLIDRFEQAGRKFTLVFIDPPYNQGLINRVLSKLDSGSILEGGGLIVVEHSKHEPVTGPFCNLSLLRSERYGETLVSILVRSTSNNFE